MPEILLKGSSHHFYIHNITHITWRPFRTWIYIYLEDGGYGCRDTEHRGQTEHGGHKNMEEMQSVNVSTEHRTWMTCRRTC